MADDNTRDDAERLERIRRNFHAPTKWDTQYDRDVHFLLAQLDARDAALRDARAEERAACAKIADLYAEHPPSGDDNNTWTAFDRGMDHMAGCMDTASFIAEAIRARLTAVPDPRSISDAAAERAKIVAWLTDGDNDDLVEELTETFWPLWMAALEKNNRSINDRSHGCVTTAQWLPQFLQAIAERIERGDHAQPESAQREDGE